MGAKMGMRYSSGEIAHLQALVPLGLFPESPLLSKEEWALIQQYYFALSLDSLNTEITVIEGYSSIFKSVPLDLDVYPAISSINFGDKNDLWAGNSITNSVIQLVINDTIQANVNVNGAPSEVISLDGVTYVLTMGNIHPNDRIKGQLLRLSTPIDTVIDNLSRPVHINFHDINGDNRQDAIISSFGHLSGSLDWFENLDSGWKKHTLRALPGSIRTEMIDLNDDGILDILALMAQGDEGFFGYINDGKGNFTEKRIISFPPSYGSTYFETADFDGDGVKEIVYVNGDNGDYSQPIMKPYHGIRIFRRSNNTSLDFEEVYFYHFNGGFKSMVEDFDLDGDLDIATISYFPDYSRTPEESFIFLENQDNSFIAQTFEESISGRWLVADRRDFDFDGDIDIILGNSLIMSTMDKNLLDRWKDNPVPLLLLENQTK